MFIITQVFNHVRTSTQLNIKNNVLNSLKAWMKILNSNMLHNNMGC